MTVFKAPNLIYLARREDGIWKLGSTQNLKLRMQTLGNEYGKVRLSEIWEHPAALAVEMMCHRLLRPLAAFPGSQHRELYRAPKRSIVEVVERCLAAVTAGDLSALPKGSAFRKPKVAREPVPPYTRDLEIVRFQNARRRAVERIEAQRGRQLTRAEIRELQNEGQIPSR